MYACVLEIGRGFFEGVCASSTMTVYLCDPPPPPLDSPTAMFQRCSTANMGVLQLSVLLLSASPTNRLMSLGERDIQKIDHVAYETYPCGRCINPLHTLAFGQIVALRAQGDLTGRSEWTKRKGSNGTRLRSEERRVGKEC